MRRILFAIATLLNAGPALAADYYVDGAGGRQLNPGTAALPFLYFWQAEQVAKPGDTIHLLPTVTYQNLSVTTSGAATAQITVTGDGVAPNLTKVAGNGLGFGVWINARYVTVQNLDVTASGPYSAIDVAANNHHVQIVNNVAHGAGGDGINAFADDYLFIARNVVYGNGTYTGAGIYGSGISVLGSLDIDASTAIKTWVNRNVVYANTNIPTCPSTGCTAANSDSDGNGIIIDDNTRTAWDRVAYHGMTSVANNLLIGNGGRGLHIYRSNHVVATDNTAYFNNQDPYEGNYMPGEIEANASGDVSIYNNILFSDGGVGINNGVNTGHHVGISIQYCTNGIGQMTALYNLVYNPANNATLLLSARKNTNTINIAQNIWANPQLKNPTLNMTVANFQPLATSPALLQGKLAYSVAGDFLGLSRTAPSTIGAYENPVQ